eukprot:jgi/Hompol1/482/HPOL_005351-RA
MQISLRLKPSPGPTARISAAVNRAGSALTSVHIVAFDSSSSALTCASLSSLSSSSSSLAPSLLASSFSSQPDAASIATFTNLPASAAISPCIVLNVSLSIPVSDDSPLDVYMDSAPMAVWTLDPDTATDSIVRMLPVARLMLPSIFIPKHSTLVNLTYTTSIFDVNVGHIGLLLRKLLRIGGVSSVSSRSARSFYASDPNKLDLIADALPIFRIPHFGSWPIAMRKSYGILPPPASINDSLPQMNVFDPSLVDADVKIVTTPSGKTQYKCNCTIAFTNPFPISIAPQPFSLKIGIYSGKTHLADATLMQPLSLITGRNTNVIVSVLTDEENTDVLMNIVGAISDGQDVKLTLRDISWDRFLCHDLDQGSTRPDCSEPAPPVDWMNDLFAGVQFDVIVPGGSDAAK